MGYRNQPIIQDFYGLGAMAKASQQVTKSVVGAADKINKAATLENQQAAKSILQNQQLYGRAASAQLGVLSGIRGATYSGGDPTLINQSIDEIEVAMQGTETQVGSIRAEALINSGTLDSKETQFYQDIINNKIKLIKDFKTYTAGMETDVDLRKNFNKNTHFIVGSNPFEKQSNFLASTIIAGEPLPDGVTQTGRTKKGDEVGYDFKVSINDPSFKGISDFDNLPESSPGFRTVSWKKNLKTWDFNLIDLKRAVPDFKKMVTANETTKDGVIASNFTQLMPPVVETVKDANGKETTVTTDLDWVNVNQFLDKNEPIINQEANDLMDMIQNPKSSAEAYNYILNEFKLEGRNYLKDMNDGTATEEEIIEEFKGYIREQFKNEFQMNDGDVVTVGGKSSKMERIPITQPQIDLLVERGIVNEGVLTAGEEQFFYKDQKGSVKKDDTDIKTWITKQRNRLFDNNSTSVIYGNKSSYGGEDKKAIFPDGKGGWIAKIRIPISDSTPNEAGGTTNMRFGKWTPTSDADVPAAGSPKGAYNGWLGY